MAINIPRFSLGNPFKNFKINRASAKKSMDWFGSKVHQMLSGDTEKKLVNKFGSGNDDAKPDLLKDLSSPKPLQLGSLYLQSYDAKHKATLDVWDSLPLFFLLKFRNDGYLGLNLHYMDVGTRIAVLGSLMEYANNDKMDETTKLKISWSLVNSISQLAPLKDCVKHYLFDHVTSTPICISPENWETVARLPIARWHYNNNTKKTT